MGRPRKPLDFHVAEGTYRHNRHGDRERREPTAVGIPKKPRGMPKEASKLWNRVVAPLVEMDVVADIDATMLEEMCRWFARYREASANVTDFKTMSMAQMTWKSFEQLAAKFGMSPRDRAQLQTRGTHEVEDPLIKMMG